MRIEDIGLVKTNCFAWDGEYKECACLYEVMCGQDSGECPFYKNKAEVDTAAIEYDIKSYYENTLAKKSKSKKEEKLKNKTIPQQMLWKTPNGHEDLVKVTITRYNYPDNIAIMITGEDTDEIITTNIGIKMFLNQFFVDTNNFPNAEDFIKRNNIGTPTGNHIQNGNWNYPIYNLNSDYAPAK